MLTALVSGDLAPADFASAFNMFANNFYIQGYISLTDSNNKREQIATCVDTETRFRAASGSARDALRPQRDNQCGAAVNFQTLAGNVPTCVQPGALLAGAQCCTGTVLGASTALENTLTGARSNEACSAHSACRSKICNIEEDGSGLCAPALTCFQSIGLNAECSAENPNCSAGICRQVDLGLEGVQCRNLAAACSNDTDCCSSKCRGNVCVEKFICTDCVGEGVIPTGSRRCCAGFYQPATGAACEVEFPPFILPTTTSVWRVLLNAVWPVAHAQVPTARATPLTNDTGLTRAQLDLIETAVKDCLGRPLAARRTCLQASYAQRKNYLAENNASRAQGQVISETFTPQQYVSRYNIPAISPRNRSDVNTCRFNTAKDNWIDASNLQRNGELFLRAFEVSYSGRGTKDFWHLPNASGAYNQENIYDRTKTVMKMLRENRNIQKDQTNYLDLLMSCQCLYTFGPEKFDVEQQTFFFQMCTGSEENKICRAGDFQESLRLPESPEAAYREGKEFPNYVEMYLANLQKAKLQDSTKKLDIDNLDSSAAGINHEEVLVRWLRMRSCNQVDVFIDTERVDTELGGLVDDLRRAKRPLPALTRYWDARLSTMEREGVDRAIVSYYRGDADKDSLYRGYVLSETKVGNYSKTVPKFLLFLFLAILGALALGPLGIIGGGLFGTGALIGAVGGLVLAGGISMVMGGGGSSGKAVVDALLKDAQVPLIETRLVQKRSCILGLFWCKTYYRILHWPVYSNGAGITGVFPFVKREERTCEQTANQAAALAGTQNNNCSGTFKGTSCTRAFYRPMIDTAIAGNANFAPWAEIMRDKMLMDPVFPEFFSTEGMSFDYQWKEGYNSAFRSGCAWASSLGKKNVKAEDKAKFVPDISRYFDNELTVRPAFQFNQTRIDAYKEAVKRYALCRNLRDCEATLYDGEHPNPRGYLDIVENEEQATLFANYVYQIHFKWRHMSSNTGIGYPLAYLENYYLALQYNVRLLTTLSIRRGLELDDASNKYAEDLESRRDLLQTGDGTNTNLPGGTYGVTLGDPTTRQVQLNTFFREARRFGFADLASFDGVADAQSVTSTEAVKKNSASKGELSTSSSALAAASRLASRLALDNQRAKAFNKATNGNVDAERRTASAARFMSAANSPTAAIPSFANPKDKTNYNGIGGKFSKAGGGASAVNTAGASGGGEIGAVDTTDRQNAAGALMKGVGGKDGDASGAGLGANGAGGYGSAVGGFASGGNSGGDTAGSAGGAGTGSDLDNAAKLTGMKAEEVQSMLDGSAKDRRKLEGGENDGLFEKVSKAYMRNLDRVLIRKKDDTLVKPKPATGTSKEQDEIKKIFNQ